MLKQLGKTNFITNLQGVVEMRKSYEPQMRFAATPIAQLQLNLNCRDEIIPVLAALRHVYLDGPLRRSLTNLIAQDVSELSRRDTGRPGFDDWQILVLAVLRMNCNFDYDKLQDQAENHHNLRTILGVDDWEQDPNFDFRRIRNSCCLIKPETIEKINHIIVRHGQQFHGDAVGSARADSFVIETNIHYPTESSLMYDGMRKIIPLARTLADEISLPRWRQSAHLLKTIKKLHRQINQLSASRIVKKKEAIESLYCSLIERVDLILQRVKTLEKAAKNALPLSLHIRLEELTGWASLTQQVRDTAHRRVVLGESVPNSEKLFSLFETHTQLYQRGKAGEPIQYGRLAMIFEDGAGFISHYYLMDRDETDGSVVVEQTKIAQQRHQGKLEELSLDRGFHSAANVKALLPIVGNVSCPSRNSQNFATEVANESDDSRRRRHRHAGIESAVGALQRGNGLKRCRDRSEVGFKRYLGLAVLGRNLQVLGRLLIAAENPDAAAAKTVRAAA
ncbi:ISNCY family transposase [Novipirellula sp. SH528]|uniref:ISNCY family transposase n=1 Tax=Novipirellula sp. SH528 TaxID=3454466 RepID=UPI003FA07B25